MEMLSQLLDFFRHLERWPDIFGIWLLIVLFLVIFCETGLVIAPFLPGDSLLFLVGAWCADGRVNLAVVLLLLAFAAVVGDAVNYGIGAYLGPRTFKYDKSWFFNKKHLLRSQEFYERYGSKTIILARFVPIVRTFAPFVAGIGRMRYSKFLAYNVVGAVAWVSIFVGAGYVFGGMGWVKKNFDLVEVAIVGFRCCRWR